MNINISNGQSVMVMNGRRIEIRGRHIYVNGKRYAPVDGAQTDTPSQEPVSINAANGQEIPTEVYGDVYITGDCRITGTVHGSVNVTGNVTGNVHAGGSVKCGDVRGSAQAGGSIRCGRVEGSAMAGGSIRHG